MEMVGAREAMTGADRMDGADGADVVDVVSTRPDGILTGPDGVLTGADGVADGPDGVLTGADGADGVSTGHDGVIAWPNGVEIRGVILVSAQEQSKLLADVAAYKARISGLQSPKIKRKTEHQCPQLHFFLRMRQIGSASVK
jgi:hypothetical protein